MIIFIDDLILFPKELMIKINISISTHDVCYS
jgi:hypothetical protein